MALSNPSRPLGLLRRACASLAAALLLASFASAPRPVAASDHQDSPLTIARPAIDLTDVFVFPSPRNSHNVVLAMDVWPLIPSNFGHSRFFDPGAMYQFKIGTGDHFTEDLVLQFKVTGTDGGQRIDVYGPAKPLMTGVKSRYVAHTGSAVYDTTTSFKNGMTVYAGPREDPFYLDLPQFFAIIPDRNYKNQPSPPAATASCFGAQGTDFLADFNVLSIVVEMPRALLADADGNIGRVNVWATTSLPETTFDSAPDSPLASLARLAEHAKPVLFGAPAGDGDTYVQVERLGRPAIKEATETFADHDATNRHTITDDALLASSIRTFVKQVAGRSDAIADELQHVLIPDAIEADLSAGGPARYLAVETNGKSGLPVAIVRAVPAGSIYGLKRALPDPLRKFGGRDLGSPAVDLTLGAVFGSLLPKLGLAPDDHKETPCLTSDHTTPSAKHDLREFPYLGDPR